MFRNDPIYLCGLYEAKLDAIRMMINNLGDSSYLNTDNMKSLRSLLDMKVVIEPLHATNSNETTL
jgi:hypothetical protein